VCRGVASPQPPLVFAAPCLSTPRATTGRRCRLFRRGKVSQLLTTPRDFLVQCGSSLLFSLARPNQLTDERLDRFEWRRPSTFASFPQLSFDDAGRPDGIIQVVIPRRPAMSGATDESASFLFAASSRVSWGLSAKIAPLPFECFKDAVADFLAVTVSGRRRRPPAPADRPRAATASQVKPVGAEVPPGHFSRRCRRAFWPQFVPHDDGLGERLV